MKNLNKIILTSTIGLRSFGFLGDKNVSAQNIFDKFKRQIINEYAGRSGGINIYGKFENNLSIPTNYPVNEKGEIYYSKDKHQITAENKFASFNYRISFLNDLTKLEERYNAPYNKENYWKNKITLKQK